jgi:hypothetical protein
MIAPSQTKQTRHGWNIFIGGLLSVALLGSIFNLILTQTLFSERFFQSVLQDQKVYEQIPDALAVSSSGGNNGISSVLMGRMNHDQLLSFYQTILPEDYLQSQIGRIFNSFISFASLKSTDLSFSLDLEPVKEKIQGEAGVQATNIILDSIPDCTADQALQFGQWLLQSPNDLSTMPICKPPEPIMGYVKPYLIQAIQQSVSILPSEISLSEEQSRLISEQVVESKYFFVYKTVIALISLCPWAALILAILLIINNIRSSKNILRNFGIPALIAGTATLLEFGFIAFLSEKATQLTPELSANASINSLASLVINSIVEKFILTGLLVGGAVIAGGLIFTVIASKIPDK